MHEKCGHEVRQVGALSVNTAEHSIRVDLTKIEAPTQLYDADVAWIEHRLGCVSLLFGKLGPDRETLKSRLEVRYPAESFITTFWGNSLDFFEGLKKFVEQWPETVRETVDVSKWSAESIHSEWASFTYMSRSGSQSALDFYHISTSALARLARTGTVEGLRMRPVVRVQMTCFELLNLIDMSEPVVSEVKEYLPGEGLKALETAPKTQSEK